MPSTTPLLDLATARQIAQRHVGESMKVTACWQRPEGPLLIHPDGEIFCFAVFERLSTRVGGTWHIAVDRSSGAVSELGTIGE